MPTFSAANRATMGECSVERAKALCTEALEICDALDLSPEIGARLQHVICSLEECPSP
jgi:hypothetical protein